MVTVIVRIEFLPIILRILDRAIFSFLSWKTNKILEIAQLQRSILHEFNHFSFRKRNIVGACYRSPSTERRSTSCSATIPNPLLRPDSFFQANVFCPLKSRGPDPPSSPTILPAKYPHSDRFFGEPTIPARHTAASIYNRLLLLLLLSKPSL